MRLPLRTVAVTVILSFTAGLLVASFAGFRAFLPGLLQGALVTVEITLGGCVVDDLAAVTAAKL
jgi:polar amino acid transport system permease protein